MRGSLAWWRLTSRFAPSRIVMLWGTIFSFFPSFLLQTEYACVELQFLMFSSEEWHKIHTCADTSFHFFFCRMIEDAEERGLISPGVTTLVEPTSGNMGLGLVLFAIQKGYRLIAFMPAKYSLDKQILLRFMGAELHLTGTISWRKLWHHLNCFFQSYSLD